MNTYSADLKEIYRYLGYQGKTPDETTVKQVSDAISLLDTNESAKSTYQIFPILVPDNPDSPIEVEGTTLLLEGKDMRTLLSECTHCVLIAVTLGRQVDQWIRETQIRDMGQAVILDACSSSLAEAYCNLVESEITAKIKETMVTEGEKFLTDRFSPGYGDLPLAIQPKFSQVLQTGKKIGLSVSSTFLMSPKKSITAIIGIADKPQPMRIKGCGFCRMRENCQYRKGGTTCGSSTVS